jgi:hypothetical protein
MIKRYEIAYSSDEPRLMLILPQGAWESLPFEIRLLRPWRGCDFCNHAGLTVPQRAEILLQGYSIVLARSAVQAEDKQLAAVEGGSRAFTLRPCA